MERIPLPDSTLNERSQMPPCIIARVPGFSRSWRARVFTIAAESAVATATCFLKIYTEEFSIVVEGGIWTVARYLARFLVVATLTFSTQLDSVRHTSISCSTNNKSR